MAIIVMTMGCGGGNGDPAPDAAGAVADAAPGVDATPPPGAIVTLTPDTHLAPAGTEVAVSWASELATSCTVTTTNGASATGTSGTMTATIADDDVVYVVARCEPAGPAAVAAIALAEQCVGEFVVDRINSFGEDDPVILDDSGDEIVFPPDACITVTGGLGVGNRLAPAIASRITTVGQGSFLMETGRNGLDFVALESIGVLGLDYQNGYFPPEFEGAPGFTYLGLPSLRTVTDQPLVTLSSGRADLRALDDPNLAIIGWELHPGPDVIELQPGVTLAAVEVSRVRWTKAPLVLGAPSGVAGDVYIYGNDLLPHAEAQAFVDSLGPVAGTVTICDNLDDDPCN